jgi:AMP-binding enzyme
MACLIGYAICSAQLKKEATDPRLPPHEAALVRLDAPLPEFAADAPSPGAPATEKSLAYVIYTAGSTGRPKGVAMPQRPHVNLLGWQRGSLAAGSKKTLQFASVSFDVSVVGHRLQNEADAGDAVGARLDLPPHPEFAQGLDAPWRDPVPAGFVAREIVLVEQEDILDPELVEVRRRRRVRRSGADDEHVGKERRSGGRCAVRLFSAHDEEPAGATLSVFLRLT